MNETASSAPLRGRDRRIQRTPLYFPERRSGFDRRSKPGWRGAYDAALRNLAGRPRTMLLVLSTIIVFNLMDLLLTVRVLEAGGYEVNPIMSRLFDMGHVPAALVKLGIVGVVSLLLWALRRYRRALEMALLLLVAFSVLMFYHVALAINYVA